MNIRFCNVTKKYSKIFAVKDLSIDLIDKVIVRTPLIPNIDKSICAITINKAISKNNGEIKDDMTVVTLKIKRKSA